MGEQNSANRDSRETGQQHAGFVVPSAPLPETLGPAWWNEAIGRAFLQFVRDNDLAPVTHRRSAVCIATPVAAATAALSSPGAAGHRSSHITVLSAAYL